MEGLVLDLDAFESGILGFLRRYRGSGGAGIVIVCGTAGSAALAGVALREGADGYVRFSFAAARDLALCGATHPYLYSCV